MLSLDPAARRLLLRVPLAGTAALLIWYAGGVEAYGRALTIATEKTLRLFESPNVTFLTWKHEQVQIQRTDFHVKSERPVYNPAAINGNFVLLLALIMATPGVGTKQGLLGSLAATAALFASHILHFILAIETIYAMDLGAWSIWAYPRWQRELFASGRYFFDIALKYALPFVFWGLFVLLPELRRRDAETDAKTVAAPEPAWKRHRRRSRR